MVEAQLAFAEMLARQAVCVGWASDKPHTKRSSFSWRSVERSGSGDTLKTV